MAGPEVTEFIAVTFKDSATEPPAGWAEIALELKEAPGANDVYFGATIEDPTSWLLVIQWDSESAFNSVCELSGGLVFAANRNNVEKKLASFVEMVRGRYIVEFPRPYNATGGKHQLVVTIDKSKAFIRPTGISVPVADAKVMADPTTVHSDPSLTPDVGSRHILDSPQ